MSARLLPKNAPPTKAPSFENAGPVSRITGSYLTELVWRSRKAGISEDQLDFPKEASADYCTEKFLFHWNIELQQSRIKNRKPSLFRALRACYLREFLIAAFFKLCWGVFILLAAFLFVKLLLKFAEEYHQNLAVALKNEDGVLPEKGSRGWLLACGFFFDCVLLSVSLQQMNAYASKMGIQVRSTLVTAIFRKALKIKDPTDSTGDIVNLCAVGCNKILEGCTNVHFLWSGPIETIAIVCLIASLLKSSVLPGVGLLCLIIPSQFWIAMKLNDLRKETVRHTDARVKTMNEILLSAKTVKYNCWESYFTDVVSRIRAEEIACLWKAAILKSVNLVVVFMIPPSMALVTFCAYVLSPATLVASLSFTVLSLFNTLRFPLVVFPKAIKNCVESVSLLHRIQEFLLKEEREALPPLPDNRVGAELVDVDIGYKKNGPAVLKNVTFSLPQGKLMSIAGAVGSGKTTLLSALLGQTSILKGKLAVGGKMAYVPQTPWIQNGTVRQNILFGQAYDAVWYRQVIKACALDLDFRTFSKGDLEEIGERGTSLSSGQRQRVAFARAVYSRADIYVLDAALSAVDQLTTNHIFRQGFQGLLKGKTIIFATHKLYLLTQSDLVGIIKEGTLAYFGPYSKHRAVMLLEELQAPEDVALGSFEEEGSLLEKLLSSAEQMNYPSGRRRSSLSRMTNSSSFRMELLRTLHMQESTGSEALENTPLEPMREEEPPEDSNGNAPDNDDQQPKPPPPPLSIPPRPPLFSQLHQSFRSGATSASSSANSSFNSDFVVSTTPLTSNGHSMSGSFGVALPLGTPKHGLSSEQNLSGSGRSSKHDADLLIRPGWPAYKSWIKGAGYFLASVSLLIHPLTQAFRIMNGTWLVVWTRDEYRKGMSGQVYYMWTQGCWVAGFTVFLFIRGVVFYWAAMKASTQLHHRLFMHIIRAPWWFFVRIPVGRLMTCFSQHQDVVDETLPDTFHMTTVYLMILVTTTVTVCIHVPWFIIPACSLVLVSLLALFLYLPPARSLKALQSQSSSKLIAHFTETMVGMSVVRAFRAEEQFIRQNVRLVDQNHAAQFTFNQMQTWLFFRLDIMGSLMVLSLCLLAIGLLDRLRAPSIGFCVSQVFQALIFFSLVVKGVTDIDSLIMSVSQIDYFSSTIVPEGPLVVPENRPAPDWPATGSVIYKDISLSYVPGHAPALRKVSFEIVPGERIGIVGRTGSGKFSLLMALCRLVEPLTGSIVIDSVDISSIGLVDLRSRMSVITQHSMMFQGSVRANLDPLGQYNDLLLWDALEKTHLKQYVESLPLKLDEPVAERGSNWSMGLQQLLCLCRAVLKGSRILVLDEATAAVDPKTEGLVLRTIKEHFARTTVLTIAHRLDTIIDSDRILFMDAGHVVEFDSPFNLLVDPLSHFARLVAEAGLAADKLRAKAVRHESKAIMHTLSTIGPLTSTEHWLTGSPRAKPAPAEEMGPVVRLNLEAPEWELWRS